MRCTVCIYLKTKTHYTLHLVTLCLVVMEATKDRERRSRWDCKWESAAFVISTLSLLLSPSLFSAKMICWLQVLNLDIWILLHSISLSTLLSLLSPSLCPSSPLGLNPSLKVFSRSLLRTQQWRIFGIWGVSSDRINPTDAACTCSQ